MIRQKAQKIKKIIPMTNGIFSHMDYTFRAEVTKTGLDIMFGTNYGQRNPSPIIEGLQSERDTPMTDNELNSLATLILQMYKPKWDKLGEIYDIEYDPIHNFLDEWEDESDRTESESNTTSGTRTDTFGHIISDDVLRTDNLSQRVQSQRDFDKTRTDNLTELETRNLANSDTRTDNLSESKTYGKTNTRTDNLLETDNYGKTSTRTDNLASTEDVTTTRTESGTEDNSVYGFNSTTAVNSDSSSTSDTNSETVDRDTTNTGTSETVEGGSDTKANTGTSANVESGTDGKSNTGTQTHQGTDTGTVTTANSGTQAEVGNDDIDSTTTNTGTRKEERDVINSGSDGRTTSETGSRSLSDVRDRSGRHFGNIGNLTSQKQILEEINLWRWNYMQEILNDVKEFCTLPVYLNAAEWQWVEPED